MDRPYLSIKKGLYYPGRRRGDEVFLREKKEDNYGNAKKRRLSIRRGSREKTSRKGEKEESSD